MSTKLFVRRRQEIQAMKTMNQNGTSGNVPPVLEAPPPPQSKQVKERIMKKSYHFTQRGSPVTARL